MKYWERESIRPISILHIEEAILNLLILTPDSRWPFSGKPGELIKVREFSFGLENLEKSGTLTIYVKNQGNLVYFKGTCHREQKNGASINEKFYSCKTKL